MPSEIRYHKSNENIDDAERATVKPLSVTYRRFTMLERVLMVAVSVFIVLAIVFGVLYAASYNASQRRDSAKNCTSESSNPSPLAKSIMDSLDWNIDPCDDFYSFSCNKWIAEHNTSASQPDQFKEVGQGSFDFLSQKLQEKETIKKYEKIDAVSKAFKDYFACMNYVDVKESEKFEQAHKFIMDHGGWNFSGPTWSSDNWELMPNLVKIHRLQFFPLFKTYVWEDIKNSTRNQLVIMQWSSNYFPAEEFIRNDTKSIKLQQRHKTFMLEAITALTNVSTDDPVVGRQVQKIFEFEKRLCEISMPRLQAINREKLYNPITIKQLQDITGDTFNWLDYFQRLFNDTGVIINNETLVNVNQVDYLKNLIKILETTDKTLLANYIMWELISCLYCNTYKYFPKVVVEKFNDYRPSRQGTTSDRSATCISYVLYGLGLPLSLPFVDEKFGEDKLKQIEDMVSRIQNVYIKDVEEISWMDAETKKIALKKAKMIKENVGFPKILLDHDQLNEKYAKLEIKDNDYFGNWRSKRRFEMKTRLGSLYTPVDKSKWILLPIMVNANYDKLANKIVLTAAILQKPFFDTSRPMSLNYGGIGMIIGHELTHSFDNKGRKYDENGNYFNWWKDSSLMEYKKRTACLAKKYSNYTYGGMKVDGEKSLDENIADNGGIKQAFEAYQMWKKQNNELVLPTLKLSDNQLFFIGSAQIWCSKQSTMVRHGPHAPKKFRVIGTLSNYPEFSKAFNCSAGSRMNPKKKCNIW